MIISLFLYIDLYILYIMTWSYHIWLEIHIKLATDSKIFCNCQNTQEFDQTKPNQHICPVCSAQPGAIPTINPECISKAICLARLFGTDIDRQFTRDRKSYFYPDIPMWYQITQFYHPIIKWGKVNFWSDNFETQDSIDIHEAHLENDTAKTVNIDNKTFIDYNRAGTPLIEIVTKPWFTSDVQVVDFLKELQKNIKSNNIWYADLEKGQMRVDVNISVSDTDVLGNRVEIKNINSYSAIRNAINYEFERQSELLSNWLSVDQETRRWDDASWTTKVMRSKENAMDYRYIPEPDLPIVSIQDFGDEDMKIIRHFDTISRYKNYWFHKEYIYGIVNSEVVSEWFEYMIDKWYDPKISAKRLLWWFANIVNDKWPDAILFDKDRFVSFMDLVKEKWYSDNISKQIFDEMLKSWSDPIEISTKFDTGSDIDLDQIVQEIINTNPTIVEQYRWGKESAVWFFIWQGMRASGWVADPNKLKELFIERLGSL